MPSLEEERFGGVERKIERLGLGPLVDEVRSIARDFDLRVLETRDSNGGAFLRRILDERFEQAGGWTKKQTGDVDWTKCHRLNGTRVCVGVEVQVSARSDMLVMDIHHLRTAMSSGTIDIAILIVPSDALGVFLTDRGPCLSDARRHVHVARADDLPFLLIGLQHDGAGQALPKQTKRH